MKGKCILCEDERVILALRAGARAIVDNKCLHEAIYCWNIKGENGPFKTIKYLDAAIELAKLADRMEDERRGNE